MLYIQRQKNKIKHQRKSLASPIQTQKEDKNTPNRLNMEQIRALMQKICALSKGQVIKANTLSLVKWRKLKYLPSQTQKRASLQNQMSISKIIKEKYRGRIKVCKRSSAYINQTMPYKELCQQLRRSEVLRLAQVQCEQANMQKEESHSCTPYNKYAQIKKYTKIMEFIKSKSDKKHLSYQKTQHKWNFTETESQMNQRIKTLSVDSLKNNNIGYDLDQRMQKIRQKWRPLPKRDKAILRKTKSQIKRLSDTQNTMPEVQNILSSDLLTQSMPEAKNSIFLSTLGVTEPQSKNILHMSTLGQTISAYDD